MSEVRIEQLETAFKQLGLEDTDLDALKTSEVSDYTPFIEKIKSGIVDNIKSDEGFIESIVRPFKDAPIGKEKQLKKEVRKFFNLQITEDELVKTPLTEMLKKGTESIKTADNSHLEEYKNKYSELLEENERLKNEVLPTEVAKVESAWKNKITEKEIKEELNGLVAKETQVPKENISVYSTAFQGYLAQQGYKLHIDEKRNLSIKDSEGMPVKNAEGTILRPKEAILEFASKMAGNSAPKGTVTNTTQTVNKNHNLLNILGKGFN